MEIKFILLLTYSIIAKGSEFSLQNAAPSPYQEWDAGLPERIELPNIDRAEFEIPDVVSFQIHMKNNFINGLDGLKGDYQHVLLPPVRLSIQGGCQQANINGSYSLKLIFGQSATPLLSVQGQGIYEFGVTDPNFDGAVVVAVRRVKPQVQIRDLVLDIQFNEFNGRGENLEINGVPVEWDQLSQLIQNVAKFLLKFLKNFIEELKNYINSTIKDCTAVELIGIIGGGDASCLDFAKPTPPNGTTISSTTSTTSKSTINSTEASDNTVTREQTTHSNSKSIEINFATVVLIIISSFYRIF